MSRVTARCDRRGCRKEQTVTSETPVADLQLFGWSITRDNKAFCPAHTNPVSVPKVRPKVEDVSYVVPRTEKSKAAYALRCPTCKAKPGEVCATIADKENSWGIYPKGSVMSRPHNDRYTAVDKARARAAKVVWLGTATQKATEGTRLARERYELGAALRDFDKREFDQLRDWLRLHGALLTGD